MWITTPPVFPLDDILKNIINETLYTSIIIIPPLSLHCGHPLFFKKVWYTQFLCQKRK